jgi:hypothetical protein
LTGENGTPIVARIRNRHLNELARAAAALPGSKLDIPLWASLRAIDLGSPPARDAAAPGLRSDLGPEVRAEIARLRALVAGCLQRLAEQIEYRLGPALEEAQRAWDQADSVSIVDVELGRQLAEARRQLGGAADGSRSTAAVAAVALEGLLALEAACGLTTLAERRLSSLIRLRLRGREREILPAGRPFLDLGAAFAEAARAWT